MPGTTLQSIVGAMNDPRREQAGRQRERLTAVGCLVAALVVFAADWWAPLGIATGVLYAAIVLMSIRMPSVSPITLLAVTATLTLVGMIDSNSVAPAWTVAANRLLSIVVQLAAAVAVMVHRKHESERRAMLREIERALGEVRQLEGLLPICAWCKRIRDESGSWQQMEAFIRDHSEADFSHGACPDCAERILREARASRTG